MIERSLHIRKGASLAKDSTAAAEELHRAIMQPDISLALFYCSPEYDLPALGRALKERFGSINLIGCTTAGEISPQGYLTGTLTGVSIASPDFKVATKLISKLSEFESSQGEKIVRDLLERLGKLGVNPTGENTFGFLLIDGLSMQEEILVSTLYRSIGNIQLFGGSAGDGTRFDRTYVYCDGAFHRDSAVFSLIQTNHPFTVFKTEHFISAGEKLVVTQANPARRIVTEINGEPAGHEYARVLGLEVNKLAPMIFATHPVIVRLGGHYYVRSIQKVNEDESLTFFCAIDEGIVLTVAKGVDLVENLRELFRDVREKVGPPQLILGCDCILRSLELDQNKLKKEVGQIMADNNVIGFATYGEQFNAMHVNQTFTGVAIGTRRTE